MRARNLPKIVNLSTLGLLGLLLLFSHQNCAPPANLNGAQAAGSGGVNYEAPLPVSVIDDVKKDMAVSFSSKQVQFSSATSLVSLEGQCSLLQEDSVLGYSVSDGVSGAEVAHGLVVCKDGKFLVPLSLDCDHPYRVHAQLGRAAPGDVEVTRTCS